MKTLLWREWHWNRVIVVAGIVIFLLPYTITTAMVLWPKKVSVGASELAYAFTSAAIFSCAMSQLTISCLGGNAMAGERSDRTAEFLGYLPISRMQRLLSKLSLTAVVTLVIWGVNGLVVWFLFDHIESALLRNRLGDLLPAKYTALTSLLMFGVAWFASSFQSSPTLAICSGLLTPIVIVLGLTLMPWPNGAESQDAKEHLFQLVYTVLAVGLGSLGFGAGTWYFLSRVEP